MVTQKKRWAYTLVATTLAGCALEADPAVTWTERDSAGIVIVESAVDLDAAQAGWSVADQPSLAIGTLAGSPEYQFFRIAGARRFPDGRIAVVNSGSQEVRVYGADGRFHHGFGADGDGPGEFRAPRLAGTYEPDSLVIHDLDLRRISIVSVDDGFARSFAVQEAGGYPIPLGIMAEGSIVYGGGASFSSDVGFPTGLYRAKSLYASVSRTGEAVTLFGDFPALEMYAEVSGTSFMARTIPFGRNTVASAAGDRLYIAFGDTYDVRAYDGSGRLRRIFRLAAPLRPVTDADVRGYIEEQVAEDADSDNERRALRQLLEELPVPKTFPAYNDLQIDRLGNLWAADYLAPGEDTPRWTVFSPDGHVLGRISTPLRTRVLEIGRDYLLTLYVDEMGVEFVRLYALQRPPL
ncbi:MAG: hypothetical protein ACC667_07640 [Longimicrobiales bacterium]